MSNPIRFLWLSRQPHFLACQAAAKAHKPSITLEYADPRPADEIDPDDEEYAQYHGIVTDDPALSAWFLPTHDVGVFDATSRSLAIFRSTCRRRTFLLIWTFDAGYNYTVSAHPTSEEAWKFLVRQIKANVYYATHLSDDEIIRSYFSSHSEESFEIKEVDI